MPITPIIVIAGIVLLVAVVLMAREVSKTRRENEAMKAEAARAKSAKAEAAPKKSAPKAPDVPSTVEEDDEDVTKVGATPKRPLPTLSSADGEEEKVASESRAVVVFEENADADEPTGPVDLILVSASGQTDCGLKRRKNEDSLLISRQHSLFVVADGMGGYGGGDIASKLAVETIQKSFDRADFHFDVARRDVPKKALELSSAIESANAVVFGEANRNSELHGMGTTVIGARFSERKQRVFIAHVGDSRCYRWRRGSLRLLTVDHTLAARGVEGPMAAHIRRAVGIAPQVKVDLLVDKPLPGDIYLLCSDGLTKMVDDTVIEGIVTENAKDLDRTIGELITRANAAGGKDNTTVVLIGVNEGPRAQVGTSSSAAAAP